MTGTRQLAAFIAVALAGAAVQLAVLWLVADVLGVPEIPAFWAGWAAGWVHNFGWHHTKVFAGHTRSRKAAAPRSFAAALAGLGVQTAVFAAATTFAPLLVAGALAAACSMPVTFLLSRRWAFREAAHA